LISLVETEETAETQSPDLDDISICYLFYPKRVEC